MILILVAVPISVKLVQQIQETRSNAKSYNDSKCEARGGKCFGNSKNVRQGDSCTVDGKNGIFVFNLCGGGSDRRCCVPDTPDDNNSSNNDPSKTLKVATFNIGNGRKHGGHSASEFASELKKYNFDIVGLQEAHSSIAHSVADKSDLNNVYFTDTDAGNAVISKKDLNSTKYNRLVKCGMREFRALQKTIININGKNISFYNVHLEPNSSCRKKQALDVMDEIRRDSNPWILVGDFNFGRSGCGVSNGIFESGNDIIYDSNYGTKCTDMIIYSKNRGIKAVSSKTYFTAGRISDHNIVSATFEVE